MKKFLIAAAAFLIAVFSASALPKNVPGKSVVLDCDERFKGQDFPAWVKEFNSKKKVAKELDVPDYKLWTLQVYGSDLNSIKSWADLVNVKAMVAQSFSTEMKSSVDAVKRTRGSSGNSEIGKTLDQVVKSVSKVQIVGLEQIEHFWVKTGTVKPGIKKAKKIEDYDAEYAYYTVWGMNKQLFNKQISSAAKTAVRENTKLDSGIMKGLYQDVMKNFASGAFEEESPMIQEKR